jgi:hypothetical protein
MSNPMAIEWDEKIVQVPETETVREELPGNVTHEARGSRL